MKIDTVIFDLGAVLAAHLHPQVAIERYGVEYTPERKELWTSYKVGECTEREFWTGILEGTTQEENIEHIMREVRDEYTKPISAGAYPFVDRLKSAGYNIAILSNHSKEWGWGAVKSLGLEAHCNPIIISADVGLAKPDPVIYQHILGELGKLPEQCIFIDDKKSNIDAARAEGLHGIVFTTGRSLEEYLKRYKMLK